MVRRKQKLVDIRDRLIADVEIGNLLPYATQRERMRRCQHLDSLIAWLDTTDRAIRAVLLVLSNPPRLPGEDMDTEQPTAEHA